MQDEQHETSTATRTLAREVNMEIERVAVRLEAVEGNFLCECGRDDCALRLRMTIDEFDSIRTDPDRFFVASGHPLDSRTRVVERRERYFIVEPQLQPR